MSMYRKPLFLDQQQTGFSLIELLVTLSIAVIVLAIATPSMSGLIRDARLSAQTDLLVRTINGTRMEAIKQRTNFKVCAAALPNSDTACSTQASDWTKGWLVIDSSNAISQRISSKSNVSISTTVVAVEFGATLGTPTAASSFTICAPGRKQMTVNISASGHVDKRIDATVCS
jgi:type IV fimbrial biogenesis protein FimT